MRLIDADAFVQFIKDTIKKQKYDKLVCDNLTVAEILESIIAELDGTGLDGFKNAPTIELEIIQCKDCRHNGSFDTDCPISWPKTEDDYCSYAERRE